MEVFARDLRIAFRTEEHGVCEAEADEPQGGRAIVEGAKSWPAEMDELDLDAPGAHFVNQGGEEVVDAIARIEGGVDEVHADSAEGVYKAALEVMGVKTEGIHASAYKAILEAQPKPGAAKPRIASDSARPQGFADRFPSAAALRKV